MEPTLQTINLSELPVLLDWLEKHLPDSRKLYFTVLSTLRGKWRGTTFYTLGWPDILAVGEGLVDPEHSHCASYHTSPRTTHVYSPVPKHAEKLLLYPGFLDWTQPIIFQAETIKLREVIQNVSTSKGGNQTIFANTMMEATGDSMPASPVPEGFELRALDPEVHTDLVLSTWPIRRRHTFLYIRELLRRFPSLGLFDKTTGQCAGFELTYEYGAIGMLFVLEEFRGRGFGKVITTNLAQDFFRYGQSVVTFVKKANASSWHMHLDCGHRECDGFDFIVHHTETQSEYFKKFGYKLTSWNMWRF